MTKFRQMRSVVDVSGGTPFVSFPVGWLDEFGIEYGDKAKLTRTERDGKLYLVYELDKNKQSEIISEAMDDE